MSRDASDMTTMAAMKQAAILMPAGLPTTTSTNVYRNAAVMSPYAHGTRRTQVRSARDRHRSITVATQALVIRANTPVAYASP
jgi:hypothetical protein